MIVNISSIAAIVGTGSNIAYGGSKAALDTMALSLARVLGPEIRVLTVSPAAVDTAFVPGRTTAMVEKVASTTPLKRVVQADEVAQAVMAAVVNLTSTTGWSFPSTAASWWAERLPENPIPWQLPKRPSSTGTETEVGHGANHWHGVPS